MRGFMYMSKVLITLTLVCILMSCNGSSPTSPDNSNQVRLEGVILEWLNATGVAMPIEGEVEVSQTGERAPIQTGGNFILVRLGFGEWELVFKHSTGVQTRVNVQISFGSVAEMRFRLRGNSGSIVDRVEISVNEIEVCGAIEQMDRNARWIQVRGEKFFWDSSTEFRNLQSDRLQVGLLVEVKGDRQADDTWRARRIESEDSCNPDDDLQPDEIELCGTIQQVNASEQWIEVQNTRVYWDNTTEFRDLSPQDLQPGLLVEVTADRQSDGKWHARRIKREDNCDG